MTERLTTTTAELSTAGRRALAPGVHRLASQLGGRATALLLAELAVEAAAADGVDRATVAGALREIAEQVERGHHAQAPQSYKM